MRLLRKSQERKEHERKRAGFNTYQEHLQFLEALRADFEKRFYEDTSEKPCNKTINDYDIIKAIGSGGYATVFLARNKTTMEYNALKVMDKRQIVKRKHQKHIILEKKILVSMNFIFVTSMNCSFKDNIYLYFVLPFLSGGDLFVTLQKHGHFSEDIVKFYAGQMVLAIEYLHYCGVVHRDIKPENILIEDSGYIKLADYGFAKKMSSFKTYTICGTPDYLAPELILSKGYGMSVDWWAMGILIYEMLVGNTPFYAPDPTRLYEKIIECHVKYPDYVLHDGKSIIRGFLSVEPSRRLGCLKSGAFDVKCHLFFKNTNWLSLLNRLDKPPLIPSSRPDGDPGNFPNMSDVKLNQASKCYFEQEFRDF